MRDRANLFIRRPALWLAGLLMLSCSANRMYRPASVEQHPDYALAFVEFDDQGELWAPSQLEKALALLERRSHSEFGTALVLYVHGWNNSASPKEERGEDGSLHRFRELLVRLKRSHRLRYPEMEIPVVGIYLGWRGEVSTVPLLRQLSFYNRRGAAERIAGASATEAIYRILTSLRANPRSRSVLIGHSFGSMILERALSQAVISALLAAPGQQLIFPADLVVLFNPAGSAIQTKQLVDILARNRLKTYRVDRAGNRFERPLLLSFTSEGDKATRRYFPLGMELKAASKKFRRYGTEYCSPISNQRWLYSHTAGHTPALFSHEVSVGPKVPEGAGPGAGSGGGVPPSYYAEYDPLTQQTAFSFDGEKLRFTIKRRPRALNDTPYWIMQVPRELIPNHSQIFSADTFALAEAALAFSGAMEVGAGTIVEREDGVRPVAVVPRPDGGALFLDRSRAVYAVRPGALRPIFLSCMRESLDPSDAVGFHVTAHLAYAALVRGDRASAAKCVTEVYEWAVENDSYRQLSQIRLAGSECFTAAAFDVPGKRVFLSLQKEGKPVLFVADLSQDPPKPSEFLKLPGDRPATVLYFDTTQRRLFAAQRESGALWVVNVGDEGALPQLVTDELGWPLALDFDKVTQRLYVTDSKSQNIWALDCSSRCEDPTVFFHSESVQHPITLSIALDGTLWLGDLEDQTLKIIAPDGRVENTIRSLSGTAESSARPTGQIPGESWPPR